jgi:hypothetical protein
MTKIGDNFLAGCKIIEESNRVAGLRGRGVDR